MIRCNNCERIFQDDSELAKILAIQEKNADGNWYTIDRIIYEGQPLENTDTHYEEVFNGCGSCLFDEFLTDIEKEEL